MVKVIERLRKNPPLVLGISFALLIFIGALLLSLPWAAKNGKSVGFINALFTASSASCVTGLTVLNTKEAWSGFGKLVILSCIQIGGLGTMSLVTIVTLILRKRIGLRDRLVLKEQLNTDTLAGMVRMIMMLVRFSFMVELMGALLLALRLVPIYGLGLGLIYSIFHAVSAFCNAGFDLFGDSIRPYVGDPLINIVLMGLVIAGGLGFQVYLDLWRKKSFKKLSLHSKMVLEATGFLLVFGALVFLILEWSNPLTLGPLSLGEKILAASFQSTISRTAGFYSVPMESIHNPSNLFMVFLMFIGGSPGSTAGGLKTTTFMVLCLTVWASIRGQEDVVWHRRTIDQETVKRAFVMAFICLTTVFVVVVLLSLFERDKDFIQLVFEGVSAFATVGLSQNVSSDLSSFSKVLISFTMFLGRVGPTSLALGLGKSSHSKKKVHFAQGKVFIG